MLRHNIQSRYQIWTPNEFIFLQPRTNFNYRLARACYASSGERTSTTSDCKYRYESSFFLKQQRSSGAPLETLPLPKYSRFLAMKVPTMWLSAHTKHNAQSQAQQSLSRIRLVGPILGDSRFLVRLKVIVYTLFSANVAPLSAHLYKPVKCSIEKGTGKNN